MTPGPPPAPRPPRGGLSLLELTACVAIAGVVAAVAVPRLAAPARAVRQDACDRLREAVDLQAARYRRDTGAWPAADLSGFAGDPAYFPAGPPACPHGGTPYAFDAATGRVVPYWSSDIR